ncbi:Protein CBG05532 [Caenorhabditis briggsae]|uniref:Protein CBG05532 n=1 Tax=Caenorhabditis briggsae TaxID=6238 RepID=A8X036_CAEBR|nr:Protein CBG05532 [Caenorhabditis briggsae]CAP25996.2 Protein CBG05532 [Caenorhabditis briggsae]
MNCKIASCVNGECVCGICDK